MSVAGPGPGPDGLEGMCGMGGAIDMDALYVLCIVVSSSFAYTLCPPPPRACIGA